MGLTSYVESSIVIQEMKFGCLYGFSVKQIMDLNI